MATIVKDSPPAGLAAAAALATGMSSTLTAPSDAAAGAPPAPAAGEAAAALPREGPYLVTTHQGMATAHREDTDRPVKLPVFLTLPCAPVPSHATLGADAIASHPLGGAEGAGSAAGQAAAAAAAAAPEPPPGPPYPTLVLFNGFQARASQYQGLARRLASFGFLVVQYNAPALTIIRDRHELPFLRRVLAWVEEQGAPGSGTPVAGRADLAQLCVAGHSRGGKLAALHFAADPGIRAAYLIDPVDCSKQAPEGPDYPSAAKALAAAGRPIGLTGAGMLGPANPEGSNWRHFWQGLPAGSWLQVLPRAGHTTFMQANAKWEGWLLDACFGGGPAPRDATLDAMVPCMVAWLQGQLRQGAGGAEGAGGMPAADACGAAAAAQPGLDGGSAGLRLMQPFITLAALQGWAAPLVARGDVEFEVKK